jgi:hypothetical protein
LWIIILGTKYKVGAVVQHGFLHLLPAFSIIKKIVVVDGKLNRHCFILESLHTIEFISSMNITMHIRWRNLMI